ncbi:uncharacterized protein EAF01_002925 [Botrytis porri]|uniref:Uncharacterized protein n=1 Tax=Botrytis porri TaxID=87229 RepID=A0A4Z1KA75_9HELO|nr:uncharacterized protein EAF01_002925 [Botrytis porri]KAF7911418.1 hypothetical protein EAF01_002925 [Botrytis porri]TGO83023.1 hypothetical protein BPOR_0717g00050 [Botrytis porri]
MPDLEKSYASLIHSATKELASGLYTITNTPWIAENTRSDPIDSSKIDYNDLTSVTIGPSSSPIRVTWPLAVFCMNSLFFRSIFMPETPTVPDTTPLYIKALRLEHQRTNNIPFPCTTPAETDAFSIFVSWNTTNELKSSTKFVGITSVNVYERIRQYNKLWDQLIECYKLSQFLIAPKFANKIIDTMICALREECGWQTHRRQLEDEEDENVLAAPGTAEYDALIDHISQLTTEGNDDLFNQTQSSSIPPIVEQNNTPNRKTKLLPPDARNILGGSPAQISHLYASTNPGSQLRQMLVQMIINYSVRYPKYYAQPSSFSTLITGAGSAMQENLSVPIEFMIDLLGAYAKLGKQARDRGWRERDMGCVYHEHKDHVEEMKCQVQSARERNNAEGGEDVTISSAVGYSMD